MMAGRVDASNAELLLSWGGTSSSEARHGHATCCVISVTDALTKVKEGLLHGIPVDGEGWASLADVEAMIDDVLKEYQT